MFMKHVATTAGMVAAMLGALACGGANTTTGIDPSSVSPRGFAGFDISIYPGDAVLSAWRHPASPYRWVGYYLAAPCHRDPSWMGTLPRVQALGWGTSVIYVGQQDWANIPAAIAAAASRLEDAALVTCHEDLLSASQGTLEAADAITKTESEGFAAGTTIYLDIEYVTAVSLPLLAYYKAWIAEVLRDGRYRPGIYVAKSNAATLHQAAMDVYATAGASGTPRFWIASSAGFAITSDPREVGLEYATVWQGLFNVRQRWGDTSLVIDANVALTPSPSAPTTIVAAAVASFP
jgi:hypothetical protein